MTAKIKRWATCSLDPLWTRRSVGLLVLILMLSLTAYAGQLPAWTQRIPHLDWCMHFLLLGGLGFFIHRSLRDRQVMFGHIAVPIGPVAASLWSLADESLQLLSPLRVFSFADMAANLLGVWLFYLTYQIFIKRKAIL